MTDPRSSRLKALATQRAADRASRVLSSRLFDATRHAVPPDSFISDADTRRLRDAIYVQAANCRDCVRIDGRVTQNDVVEYVRVALRDIDGAVLIVPSAEYGSGFTLDAKILAEVVQSVWGLAGDDLLMCTPDISNGLCAEVQYHDEHGPRPEGILTLRAWGLFVNRSAGSQPSAS